MAQAKLNGMLRRDGGEACNCGFQWGISTAYGSTTPTYSRRSRQGFSHVLSGLGLNMEYHFRAFATNSAGTSYGADESFIISELPPLPPAGTKSVLTSEATEITGRYSTINGVLMDDGGELCNVGFQWGLDPSNLNNFRIVGTGVSSVTHFSGLLQGLTPSTTYYYRAFASDQYGALYSYGAILSFTTEAVEGEDTYPPPLGPPDTWNGYPPPLEPPDTWDPYPPPWVPYPPPTGRITFDFLNVGIVLGGVAGIAIPLIVLPGEGPIAHTQPVSPYRESAVLLGIIADDKDKACEACFRWRRHGKGAWTITSWRNNLKTDYGFSESIMKLTPGAKYEFQAQARHVEGKLKGPWSKSEYFTTLT